MSQEPEEMPITFRREPSEPISFEDGPGTFVDITIDAPPSAVWPIVLDLNHPAEHSSEYQGGEWLEDGPAQGATFVGRNNNEMFGDWEIISYVDEFEPERVFGWRTSDPDNPGATWRYFLEPSAEGTRLRHEVTLGPGPSGLTFAIESRPEFEDRIIEFRVGILHHGMLATVEGIKAKAERT